MEPVTASDWHNPNTGEPARAITLPEIEAVQHAYLDSARRLYRAGYDAVELHAANGYLFQQFLSPRINRREDRYGGSIENRMRFLTETVALIRGELPGFPLMVRVSATEYCEGGYTEQDMIALVPGAGARWRDRDRHVGRHQREPGVVALLHPAALLRPALSRALRAPDRQGGRHPDHHGRARHRPGGRGRHPPGRQR